MCGMPCSCSRSSDRNPTLQQSCLESLSYFKRHICNVSIRPTVSARIYGLYKPEMTYQAAMARLTASSTCSQRDNFAIFYIEQMRPAFQSYATEAGLLPFRWGGLSSCTHSAAPRSWTSGISCAVLQAAPLKSFPSLVAEPGLHPVPPDEHPAQELNSLSCAPQATSWQTAGQGHGLLSVALQERSSGILYTQACLRFSLRNHE